MTLRLHGIKKLTSVSLEYALEYILVMPIFYLSGESPPFGYSFFVINFSKSKLVAISVPVLKLPEENALFSLLAIYLLLRNQVSVENIGIKVSAVIIPS